MNKLHTAVLKISLSMVLCLPVLANGAPMTPLESAVKNGDRLQAERLLEAGADPDAPGEFDTPPLQWAAYYNDPHMAGLLLEAGADPDLRNPQTEVTALALAVKTLNPALVEVLLEAGANPDLLLSEGETALMWTARDGVPGIIELLLEAGASVDYRHEEYGHTALKLAANAGNAAIVKQLLEAGADPDAATYSIGEETWVRPNGQPGYGFGIGIIRGGTPADRGRRDPLKGKMTALLYAARHGHTDVANVLLDGGADINKAEANEIFPLLMAISNDNMEMAELLIARGSRINGADWYGRSPLWEAVNVRNLYLDSESLDNYVDRDAALEVVELLIAKGADVNARTAETPPFRNHFLGVGSLEWVDFTGQTPFLSAALSGDVTVMKLLLEHGADPFINTYQGTSALMAAAGINWVVYQTYTEGPEQLLEAVKLCFELGMDVNQVNSMGLAAIHGAANRGSNDIIEFLVEQGARLDVTDNEGRTPLDWARGVFLATHPAEAKPESMLLLTELLKARGMPVR